MTTNNTINENINTWISQINTEYKAAISVDCVIFGYDENHLRVLLLKSDMPPFEGKWTTQFLVLLPLHFGHTR